MKRGRRRKSQEDRSVRVAAVSRQPEKSAEAVKLAGRAVSLSTVFGIALIVLFTVIIYGQTLRVPTIDYEDSYYLCAILT